jgi:DNA-binding protein H-NS
MSFDINTLNGLSARELKSLIRTAQKQQDLVSKRPAITKVRAQVNKILRESGYTVAELYDVDVPAPAPRGRKPGKVAKKAAKGTKGKSKGIVPPKYRNPANGSDTWTGRGKAPRWMADLLAKGKKKEDFLIG